MSFKVGDRVQWDGDLGTVRAGARVTLREYWGPDISPADVIGGVVVGDGGDAPDFDMVLVEWRGVRREWEYTEDLMPIGG